MNLSLGASAITGVDTDRFPEQLLDLRDERMALREIETREGDVGGFKTPGQGAGVVRFWCWDLLGGDLGGPEFVGFYCLCGAIGGDSCIGPGDGAVAIFFGPVALCWVSFGVWDREKERIEMVLRSRLGFRSRTQLHCGSLHHGGPLARVKACLR